jgi:hypothetical protein
MTMADPTVKTRTEGLLASFDDPGALLEAARKVRKAGYTRFDCHSPYPIHGMDDAMGLRPSIVGYIAGIMGTIGFLAALWLQWWTSAVDYPLVIAGKPFFSYQAFVPVTFGITVLFSALGAVLGMLHVNRLPQLYHSVFHADSFASFSDDGFFVSIEADDPRFDAAATRAFLESIGSTRTEVLES